MLETSLGTDLLIMSEIMGLYVVKNMVNLKFLLTQVKEWIVLVMAKEKILTKPDQLHIPS